MPAELKEPETKDIIEVESLLPHDERERRRQQRADARKAWRKLHVWHPHQLRPLDRSVRYAATVCLGWCGDRADDAAAQTSISASRTARLGRITAVGADRGSDILHWRWSVARVPPRPLNGITLCGYRKTSGL